MWEEAVQCKIIGGNPDQGMKLLSKLTKEQQTSPQMLCVLGDVKKDPSYYHQAWEKSNQRLARAQRSIAKYHFYKKEFDLAIPAFEKSLKLNSLDINSLSNLGYMHMAKGNAEKAIDCYSSIVSIDDNQSMAWANLSLLYRQQGKMKEALKTCQTAAAKNERNYQMLMNLQNISFDCQEFAEFIRATLKIIQLNKAEVLKEIIFKKMNFVMELLFETIKNDPSKIRNVEINFQKIEQIYAIMIKKFPLRDFLWIQFINFQNLNLELLKMKKKEKMQAEKENRNIHFFVPIVNYQEMYSAQIKKKFIIMQKRIHAKMPIGWQEELKKCEEVLGLVEEHEGFFKVNIGSFKEDERKKYGEELKMQISTVKGFIEKIKKK
jgi:tetratricopeptide (TPR) repeat protein